MAKVVGIVGGARGKIGNMVYAVNNGIQTARVYQPVVANPRTRGQLEQRAKMNLVGRISALVSSPILSGLQMGNARANRSEFSAIMLKAATISPTITRDVVAELDPRDIMWSKGAAPMGATLGTVTIDYESGRMDYEVQRNADVSADVVVGVRIIALVTEVDDGTGTLIGVNAVRMKDVLLESAAQVSGYVQMPLGMDVTQHVQVYVAPFAVDAKASGLDVKPLYDNGNEITAYVTASNSETLKFGDSIYWGQAARAE